MEDLLRKWKASPYFRGNLSSWYDVNPKTLLPKFEDEDDVSFIPMEAVDDKDGRIYLQESTFEQVRKGYTVFKENDLLWAKITPCMQNGKSSVAYGLKNGVGFGSTEFHVLRAKDKNVSIEFLWNILRLDSFLKAAQGAFGGSAGQQRVPATFISNLPIPLPPLPIQEKLVEEMERARESRRHKLLEADALLSTLDGWLLETLGITPPPEDDRKVFAVKFNQLNGRIDTQFYLPTFQKIQEAISKVSYSELGELVSYSSEMWDKSIANENDTFRYIEISGVNRNTGEAKAEDVLVSEAPSRARKLVREGDIIVSLTRPHHGSIAQIDSSLDNCVASTGFSVLRYFNEARIIPSYLWAILIPNQNSMCV